MAVDLRNNPTTDQERAERLERYRINELEVHEEHERMYGQLEKIKKFQELNSAYF